MHGASVRHIVLFDFSKLPPKKTEQLIEGFASLKKIIPEILRLEWGTANVVEGSSLGFTHCFILTFADFDSLTYYLNHAEHRKYEKEVTQHRKQVLVFDYAIQE